MKKKLFFLGFIMIIFGLFGCSQVVQDTERLAENGKGSSSSSVDIEGQLKVYYLDVEQGDSILIQTANGKNVLIDGGNNHKGDLVVQYLKALHVKTLDAVIGTHPDADHIGGLDTVLKNLEVKAVYVPRVTHTTITYEDFILAVKKEGLKLKEAKEGVSLELTGMDAKLVAPVKRYGADLNTWSAVLRVTHGDNSFLFTGDATMESERDMIRSGADLRADVLKLGHHGADTSTGDHFLKTVKPSYAIVSAGRDNQYGHPSAEVMQRLKERDIKVYRTDELGTIMAASDGKTITFHHIKSLANQSSKQDMELIGKTTDSSVSREPDRGLKAAVDDVNPKANSEINLIVTGIPGAKYQAVLHYKSKDTIYEGTVGTPLPIRIGRAAAGVPVPINITVNVDGKTYKAETSFTPK